MQQPLFTTPSEWRPPNIADLPDWTRSSRVAIDVETCDPHLKKLGAGVRRGGYICGFAFAIEDGPRHYLPVRHEGGDNMELGSVLNYLETQAANYRGELVGARLGYDMDYLIEEGLDFKPSFWRDVQVAEPLIDDLQLTYGLDAILKRHGLPGKDETLLRESAVNYGVNAKTEMHKLPARYVGSYAQADVDRPLLLLRRQERKIEEQDLRNVYDLESRVLPALTAMTRRGVRIDLDHLKKVEEWAEREEAACLQDVYDATGVRIKVGETDKKGPVAEALHKLGVKLSKTPSGQWSITASILKKIEEEHPSAGRFLRAKKVAKLRTTFAQSIRTHLTDGRIHCTFNGLKSEKEDGEEKGALYGRLSSTDPNLQQQPSRDDFANFWRAIYIPDEGKHWACLDYSQQEPRWLTHFAELSKLKGAEAAAHKYRTDPTTDNHQLFADLTGLPRKEAKIMYLGKCYEMGGSKFAHSLGLPTKWVYSSRLGKQIEVAGDEAQAIIDQFDNGAPFVKKLSSLCQSVVKERGYIKTLSGRRCRFKYSKDWGKYVELHKALNRLIQGSSADQTKTALVVAHEQGIPLQLQVHDELDLSVNNREEANHLADIMRTCSPCNVPAKVDVEMGPNWGDISLEYAA